MPRQLTRQRQHIPQATILCRVCNNLYQCEYYHENKHQRPWLWRRKLGKSTICGHLTKSRNNGHCRRCYDALRSKTSNGYRKMLDIDGISKRQRIIKAERALGRKLKALECVHHINGLKFDNRNSNLLICTLSYHGYLHHKMAELYQRKHFGTANA